MTISPGWVGTIGCWCLLAALAASARAVVGVNDPCPVPTPYPPPGAGWAEVHNPSFENGFTGGGANEWVSWKDDSFTGQVHFEGTDYYADGTRSQKLSLPQVPIGYNDQEAGLYQQIYVVPGGTYTATARVRLNFPPQIYDGEDLVARIGLDPNGEADGDGFGAVWCNMVGSQDQWITVSITVEAALPVMTLSLKATRKWAQHGDGALAWFDQVTFTGPVPTDPPPGEDPDPVDPETLIPDTVGDNLIANASFEQSFIGGVSTGWNKWWTAGTGTWKRSCLAGKVGGGNYAWCGVQGDIEDMKAMKAKTYLVQDRKGYAEDLGGEADLQDSVIVGRIFIDDHITEYLSDPTFYGRVHADNCHDEQLNHPRIDCWQGLNEPDWGTDLWYDVLAFEKAFAERCHEWGIKSCVLNLSTGSPGNIWKILDAHELLDVADYLGHHVYGGPADELMVNAQNQDGACSFALRARRFKDMYDRRGWRFPPVIYTEGTTYGGWHGNFSPQEITDDLTLYGQYMNADRWNTGLTIFDVGGCGVWAKWDITGYGIAQPVGVWNQAHPADAMDGLYSQMFGAGKVHPMTVAQMTPDGDFNGGINRQVTGLSPEAGYLVLCWMKYEFRGQQPDQFEFHIGVDPTGQTSNGNASSIDWDIDQIADKAPVHEIFSHVWRTFTATSTTASIWLRASHPVNNPSIMAYVDLVEVRQLTDAPPPPTVRPDFDRDGDVDQVDFGHLQRCLTGPGIDQPDPVCADTLLDQDEDVDVDDFAIFQGCISGPGIAPVLGCDD